MTIGIHRDNITIVLQRPRYPENIGSAARAMCNMGFSRLIVVDPGIWDEDRIRRLATHAAGSVIDTIKRFDTLDEALSPFSHVVGTTARLGGQRSVVKSPAAGLSDPLPRTPRLAKRIELDQMYGELTSALVDIGYVNPQNPEYWMIRIRRFFTRISLRAGEASIIRGICRQIGRYGERRYAEGVRDGGKVNSEG